MKKMRVSDTYLNLDLIRKHHYDFMRGMMRQGQQMRRPGFTGEV